MLYRCSHKHLDHVKATARNRELLSDARFEMKSWSCWKPIAKLPLTSVEPVFHPKNEDMLTRNNVVKHLIPLVPQVSERVHDIPHLEFWSVGELCLWRTEEMKPNSTLGKCCGWYKD